MTSETRTAMRSPSTTKRAAAGILAAVGILVLGALALRQPGEAGRTGAGSEAREVGIELRAQLTIERSVFRPGRIELWVRNGGQLPVEISQVSVNEAYWTFEARPQRIARLETSRLAIPYPWEQGEPLRIEILTADGQTAVTQVDFPVATASSPWSAWRRNLWLGAAIGLVPVALGLCVLPLLRRRRDSLEPLFLAFTVGVLAAVGTDAAVAGLDAARSASPALGGRLLLAAAAVLAYTATSVVSGGLVGTGSGSQLGMRLAWALAIAIGVHNMGEGLAVAGAEAAGALRAGSALAIGFAVHNVSEGFALASAVGDVRLRRDVLILGALATVAGMPAAAGLFVGGAIPSPVASIVLLGIGLGAVAQVLVAVARVLIDRVGTLEHPRLLASGAVGFALMYLTSLLVAV